MIVLSIWIGVAAAVFVLIQWLTVFRGSKGTAWEKAASITILLAAAGLNLALYNDWLTTSPLIALRNVYLPAAKALQQWGMAGG